jgi:ankyrin repeat protein
MEDKNMKPNIRDVNGRTPLLVAAYFRRNEIVCYLLRRCDRLVDMTVVDKYGYGLLHFAAVDPLQSIAFGLAPPFKRTRVHRSLFD